MKFKKYLFILCFPALSAFAFSQETEISSITIKGAKKTKNFFIKSLLTAKVGQVLDSTSLDNDIILLKRLPAISHAYYQVFYSHKNLYNVFIYVEENFTIIPNIFI